MLLGNKVKMSTFITPPLAQDRRVNSCAVTFSVFLNEVCSFVDGYKV